MSYDLTFLVKDAGQSWQDALEALGEDESGDPPDAHAWATVLHHARELLGEVSEQHGDAFYQLEHESTGIELNLYAAEAGITVPYWYRGEDAQRIVQTIYDLGRIVRNTPVWLATTDRLNCRSPTPWAGLTLPPRSSTRLPLPLLSVASQVRATTISPD